MSQKKRDINRPGEAHAVSPAPAEKKSDTETERFFRILYAKLRHELRMPLNAIIGYSEILIEDTEIQSQEECLADLGKIHSLGKKVLGKIDQILDATKIEGGGKKDDLSLSVPRLREELSPLLTRITSTCEELTCSVEDDGDGNVVSDLKKICTAADRFLVSLDNIAHFERTTRMAFEEGRYGTDTESMVQSVMDAIRPLADDKTIAGRAGEGNLLVVDDDKVTRDLLERRLKRHGHAVAVAENGRDALASMKSTAFDLVLLDILMPEMNGFEVLEVLKSNEALADIPVIVTSALDEMDSVVRCIQMGAEDYLLKPINNVLLEARIRTCLEKKRFKELCDAHERRDLQQEVRFIAESREMQSILSTVRTVSQSPVNVLIHGESGTGKEVIARLIHSTSDRKDRSFVAVNCASIPENLMESEFFGYEKGAFTGAVSSRGGRFEEASGGILFLDEIADMPMVMQPKFLRALQEGEGRRLGGGKNIPYDLRIISATNKDIRREVADGRFREDLFYRLFAVEIHAPPLRERREDIIPLAMFFLGRISNRFKKQVSGFSPDLLDCFREYPWPGNIRQLLHEVERLVAITPGNGHLSLSHCSQELQMWKKASAPSDTGGQSARPMPEKVRELEMACIRDALQETGGNKVQASKLLGISRMGLDKKMKRYGINPSIA